MKHLFSDWDKLRSKIDNSPRVFLLFDYDGTLSPIAPSPSEAKFPSTVKGLIRRLRRNSKFALAIISGRSMKDIKKMVGLKGITYIGNHGLEIEGRNTEFLGSRFHAFIKKIESALYREVKHTKGAKIEHKGVTLSLHYRLVKNRDKALIKRKFYRIVRPFVYSGKVRISSGKQVLEVRPNIEWDKGSAVTWLLKRKRGQILPLYFGDDVTDIDAFRAIKGKGISVFVGNSRKSVNADYFLRDPKEVEKFIKRLVEL